jgi:hypothetical protein
VQVVGLDCFYIGLISGTKGAVWQSTTIDVFPVSRGQALERDLKQRHRRGSLITAS